MELRGMAGKRFQNKLLLAVFSIWHALGMLFVVAADYPGLSTLDLMHPKNDAQQRQIMAAADWAGANGGWQLHLEKLTEAIQQAARGKTASESDQNLDAILTRPHSSLALEQARFIKTVGTGVLNDFCKDPQHREFVHWIVERAEVLTTFNGTFLPENNSERALALWFDIWKENPPTRESLSNLAIACAVVFDKPVRINRNVFGYPETSAKSSGQTASYRESVISEVNGLQRFCYYRDRFKEGRLHALIDKMQPWELIWVVDAPVPESELLWALDHVHYARNQWGNAYGAIRYRMDKAINGVNPYKAYTLAEILKNGGVCVEQGYYASITAKAHGIPAMMITCEGNRGLHLWFGFEDYSGHWNLTTGRYSDSYVAGTTIDPQTRRRINEDELNQLIDPERRGANYEQSVRILALTRLFNERSDTALAIAGCTKALKLAPHNIEACKLKLDLLEVANVPAQDWLSECATLKGSFLKFPDWKELLNKRQMAYVSAHDKAGVPLDMARNESALLRNSNRTDIYIANVVKEVDLATQSGSLDRAVHVYQLALNAKGNDLVFFKELAASYYKWGKANAKGPQITSELLAFFDSHLAKPGDDNFYLKAYLNVLSMLLGYCHEQDLRVQEQLLQQKIAKFEALQERLKPH